MTLPLKGFIILHKIGGKVVYISAKAITTIEALTTYSGSPDGTALTLYDSTDTYIAVEESPDEVIQMIEEQSKWA